MACNYCGFGSDGTVLSYHCRHVAGKGDAMNKKNVSAMKKDLKYEKWLEYYDDNRLSWIDRNVVEYIKKAFFAGIEAALAALEKE
jgi:hypothetical protein